MVTPCDYETCARLAGEILIPNVLTIVSNLSYRADDLIRASRALRAIQWVRSMLPSIGGARLTRFMGRLRISRCAKKDPRGFLALSPLPMSDGSAAPSFDFECWGRAITRRNLYVLFAFEDWLQTVRRLEERLISTPNELAATKLPRLGSR